MPAENEDWVEEELVSATEEDLLGAEECIHVDTLVRPLVELLPEQVTITTRLTELSSYASMTDWWFCLHCEVWNNEVPTGVLRRCNCGRFENWETPADDDDTDILAGL